jgi:glucokinase
VREEYGVGVDLGATRARVCVGNRRGKLLWRASKVMPLPGEVEDYVGNLVDFVGGAFRHLPNKGLKAAIGVASIGPLDLRKGRVARPANLPYESVSLVRPLEEAFGSRVVLMNDANAAALGERAFGAGKNHENLVYVTISTGIGGGAIVDGHLLTGKDGNAAEIGHVVVDPSGRLTCGCGRKGHWEAYCSGKGIPRLANLLVSEESTTGGETRLSRLLKTSTGPIDAAAILKAAARGDRFGGRVAREMGMLNALGVANVVNMFDPSLITFGGGVALNNQAMVLDPIRELITKYSINRVPQLMITPLGDDAGLLGALSVAFSD